MISDPEQVHRTIWPGGQVDSSYCVTYLAEWPTMDAKNALNIQRDLCDSLPYSCIAVISKFVEKCWERQNSKENTPQN